MSGAGLSKRQQDTDFRRAGAEFRHLGTRNRNSRISQSWNLDSPEPRVPQRAAAKITDFGSGGVPTRPSSNRQLRSSFASRGGTGDARNRHRLTLPEKGLGRLPRRSDPSPAAGGKSAFSSGSCDPFCAESAVDTIGPHDKLENRKRCVISVGSAALSPRSRALARSEGAARDSRWQWAARTHVHISYAIQAASSVKSCLPIGFLRAQCYRLCAAVLSCVRTQASVDSGSRHYLGAVQNSWLPLSPRPGMSVAGLMAKRAADPSAELGNEEAV
jgi:hypothetical protein